MENNVTRPKRLDDFKYIKEPETTNLFLDQLAKLRFHGVSVSSYLVAHRATLFVQNPFFGKKFVNFPKVITQKIILH